MKFSQLKAAFELHCGTADLVDAAELAVWFNEAQNDLALYFAPAVRAAYFEGQNQAADGTYPLPADCLRPLAVINEGSRRELRPVISGQGRLYVPLGNFELLYHKLPRFFTGLNGDEQSELAEALHDLIPLFAAARYWDKESEGDYSESALGTKWMSYYFQARDTRHKLLQGLSPLAAEWQVV